MIDASYHIIYIPISQVGIEKQTFFLMYPFLIKAIIKKDEKLSHLGVDVR